MSNSRLRNCIIEIYRALLKREISDEELSKRIKNIEADETIAILNLVKEISTSNEFLSKTTLNHSFFEVKNQDIFYAYKFFLGRQPENDNIYKEKKDLPSTDALVNQIVSSREFKENSILKNQISLKRKPSEFQSYVHKNIKATDKKFLVISGCQGKTLADLLQAKTGNINVPNIYLNNTVFHKFILDGGSDYHYLLEQADIIYTQKSAIYKKLKENPKLNKKIRILPLIEYIGFQPDQFYILNKKTNQPIIGPLGEYQSILAATCFYAGFSEEKTKHLFNTETYKIFGYPEQSAKSKENLLRHASEINFPLDKMIQKWDASGIWMRTINHPKKYVLSDLIDYVLNQEGINYIKNIDDYVSDELSANVDWPSYSEIHTPPLSEATIRFKIPKAFSTETNSAIFFDLNSFINLTFASLKDLPLESIKCERLGEPINLNEYIEKLK